MSPHHTADADAWADHLVTAALGMMDLLAVHLGDRLGWYAALTAHGPLDATELAARTATYERYAREWLEQQATSGFLTVEGDRYRLPPGAAEVLTDVHSLAYSAPLARMLAASAAQLPALVEAYRSGGGVSWAQLGDDARWSQADINRPWFEQRLEEALAGVTQVDAVLSRPGCRIADVACGAGWSALALARAYPGVTVTGIDVDAPSIAHASAAARDAGLQDRVRFIHGDAAALEGDFDAAFIFEALHDMPDPVGVLAALHRTVQEDGAVVVMDEAVAESLTPGGDEVERLMYGYSLLVCLPDAMSAERTAATGTVMRPATMRAYAERAGFSRTEVLPIADFAAFRFYRLHHAG